jgi:hypothetical protein
MSIGRQIGELAETVDKRAARGEFLKCARLLCKIPVETGQT